MYICCGYQKTKWIMMSIYVKEKRRREEGKKKIESMMFRTDYFCFENLHFHFTNIRIEEIHKRIKLKLTLGCYNGIRFGGILY